MLLCLPNDYRGWFWLRWTKGPPKVQSLVSPAWVSARVTGWNFSSLFSSPLPRHPLQSWRTTFLFRELEISWAKTYWRESEGGRKTQTLTAWISMEVFNVPFADKTRQSSGEWASLGVRMCMTVMYVQSPLWGGTWATPGSSPCRASWLESLDGRIASGGDKGTRYQVNTPVGFLVSGRNPKSVNAKPWHKQLCAKLLSLN